MQIDPATLKSSDAYRLLTSTIVPRPIAWIGSRSRGGVDNLAPFSYFMGVGSRPPSLAVSISRLRADDGSWTLKDSARNILETGEFTVSIVPQEHGEAMVGSSLRWPSDVSEFDVCGIERVRGERVAASFPAMARATMECRLLRTVDLDTTHLLVGEVVLFHFADGLLDGRGRVVPGRLDPLARLGGVDYCTLGELRSIVPPELSER